MNIISNKDLLRWIDLKRIWRLEEWENKFDDNGMWDLGMGEM